MKQIVISFSILFNFSVCFSQVASNANYQKEYLFKIVKATDAIKIDGQLNEASWQNADYIKNFWQKYPVDTGKAQRQTEVRVSYDNNFLYIGIINYDSNYYVIQTLKRDVDLLDSDGIGIILDPMNGRTNGFLFTVNAFNVQLEALLAADGGGNFNISWDNKWFSQTTRQNDRWTAEVAIPFKTLRYEAGKTVWGINFIRADMKNYEYSTWTKIPVNLAFFDFGYTGALVWDTAPPPPGRNISVIPYLTGGLNSNREKGEMADGELNMGFDAKIALSSKMNLDITVNPDFSQVEVDQQVTNLTRFNIFFPEKRTFFIENADLFTTYGHPDSNPFYSRTIGLDKDANRIPIYGGLRLTGNLTKELRIGILNMQTGKKDNFDAQNYSAVSFTQRVLKRSIIKGYYLGREAFMSEQKKKDYPLDRYGRNAGFELGYTNNKGTIQTLYGFHKSWKHGIDKDDLFMHVGGGYFGRKVSGSINYDNMGTNYYADMGFIQRIENYDAALDTTIRLGYHSLLTTLGYTMFPKKGRLSSHNVNFNNNVVWNPDGTFNERASEIIYAFNFKNTGELRLGANNHEIHLLFPTAFTEFEPLPKGTYHYGNYNIQYRTDARSKFIFNGGIRVGSFYNGKINQYIAGLRYRVQPWGSFELEFEQNELKFPNPYGNASFLLIAPRIEINFSNSIFWTTFIQYNTQENNININSRLQWRYKPMSDFFVVYTDNYFSDPLFKNRNRAIVFKMNYWLNL